MANLVTERDILNALEHGCWHNAGYYDYSMCRSCREDVIAYIKRLLYSPSQEDRK